MDRSPYNPSGSPSGNRSGDPDQGFSSATPDGLAGRSDDSLIASEFRALGQSLDLMGAMNREDLPAGLADRVFAASRIALPDSDVLAHIADLSAVPDLIPASGGRASTRVRWARLAFATAAVLAVVASSWIAFRSTPSLPRGNELIASDDSQDPASHAPGNAPRKASGAGIAPASAAAELTLVALQYPNQYRNWISEETLGGGEAARLAAPVLRTQGAAIDDIEGELEAILGLPASGSTTGSGPNSASLGSY